MVVLDPLYREQVLFSVIRSVGWPSAVWRAPKPKFSPIATRQIPALDAELASFSLRHREEPCLLFFRFESLAPHLAEGGEPIWNSTLLSRSLKFPPTRTTTNYRGSTTGRCLIGPILSGDLGSGTMKSSRNNHKREAVTKKTNGKGVAAVSGSSITSKLRRSPRVRREYQRQDSRQYRLHEA